MDFIEILSFLEMFVLFAIAVFLLGMLIYFEKKRSKYEKAQEERENTILERTDAILLKITQIEWQKTKIQKEVFQHDIRIDQAEKDIKELFKIVKT